MMIAARRWPFPAPRYPIAALQGMKKRFLASPVCGSVPVRRDRSVFGCFGVAASEDGFVVFMPGYRARRGYTNEPYQYVQAEAAAGRLRLVQADESQALLESQVMQHLARGGEWWAHPTGIASVRISPSQLLIHLDSHTISSGDTSYQMAAYALDQLLPYAEDGLQVHNAIGLRAKAANNLDLVLTYAGRTARVVLRATKGTNWGQLLAKRKNEMLKAGVLPLWTEPTLTPDERGDLANHPLVRSAEHRIAWLGSGLLRRIALFENHSSAYSTRSWMTGDEWVFELDTAKDVPLRHDGLLDRLTDPVWGLPVKITSHHCSCRAAAQQQRTDIDYECIYRLAHRQNRRGILQIRFRSVSVHDRQNLRRRLADMGADPAWLGQVLPLVASDFLHGRKRSIETLRGQR